LAGANGVNLRIVGEKVIKNWRKEMTVELEHEDCNRLNIEVPKRKDIQGREEVGRRSVFLGGRESSNCSLLENEYRLEQLCTALTPNIEAVC